MKINGSNFFSTGNLISVDELNLRDGQKIIGKVVNTAADEALLEMAGHSLKAKIEGAPQVQPGAVLKFMVKHDPEGRVLLKVLGNADETTNSSNSGTIGDSLLRKGISAALTKEGLPVTEGSIENFVRILQNFQGKYQQSLPPQVLAFITAQKWPVNPETIMTSWLFQDKELRDLLWNLLRKPDDNQRDTGTLTRLILKMSTKPEELQSKLQTLAKQIDALVRYVKENDGNSVSYGSNSRTNTDGLFRQLLTKSGSDWEPLFGRDSLGKSANGSLRQLAESKGVLNNLDKGLNLPAKDQTASLSQIAKSPIINELKQLASKLAESFEPNSLLEKVEILLDRNLALNKAVLQENSVNGNYNLIPLLVNDPHNVLHEVLIKWREEPGEGKDKSTEQVLRMNIPTENLGEIHLTLRTGMAGTQINQINLRVDNDSIRRYVLQNLDELKGSVKNKALTINIGVTPNENPFDSPFQGVDLWI